MGSALCRFRFANIQHLNIITNIHNSIIRIIGWIIISIIRWITWMMEITHAYLMVMLSMVTEWFNTNPTPLSPLASLASLERCISNPLVRGYSNVSVSSDNEGAHFVPFGRGHDDIANMNNNNNSQSTSNIDAIFGFSPN
eukprot:443144_1